MFRCYRWYFRGLEPPSGVFLTHEDFKLAKPLSSDLGSIDTVDNSAIYNPDLCEGDITSLFISIKQTDLMKANAIRWFTGLLYD
ncbi:hypothetical protein Tcan_15855 [Toxocara canis]|uniref:Uncharacterized protein n=1 Tax=Toxocara canis TaxID=6265 RepID=A0A0B2UTL3_TOXCA|nr:hypothetical protein Tcan_15855 [Toxocara canis]